MKKINFKGFECELKFKAYPNNRPYLTLIDSKDGQQVARCTVNLETRVNVKYAIIKNYSENEGIYEALLKAKIIKNYKQKLSVGFTEVLVCELNVCRICDDNIHIPKVCKPCADKILKQQYKQS
jgi:hypothetical protein